MAGVPAPRRSSPRSRSSPGSPSSSAWAPESPAATLAVVLFGAIAFVTAEVGIIATSANMPGLERDELATVG